MLTIHEKVNSDIFFILSDGHVETTLFDFIFDVATTLLTLVAKHLGEHPLQGIVAHLAADRLVTVVADVEGGAEEVAGAVGGVLVVALQTGDVVHRAQHAGDDKLIEGHSLDIKAIVESLSDVLEQDGGTWHEVRNAAGEAVNVVVRTLADIDQFLLTVFGISTVLYWPDAPMLGSHYLYGLTVRERRLVVRDGADGMEPRGMWNGLRIPRSAGIRSLALFTGSFVMILRADHDGFDKSQQGNNGKEAEEELALGRSL